MDNERELDYHYAWNWFKHHAEQRYWAFNYFLLVIGALAYGYSQIKPCEQYLRASIGVFAFVISLAFLFIEKRNNTLVNDGRAALEKYENKYLKNSEFKGFIKYEKEYRGEKGCWALIAHKFWFRVVIIVSMVASLLAILYAIKPPILLCLSKLFGCSIVLGGMFLVFFVCLFVCVKERFDK